MDTSSVSSFLVPFSVLRFFLCLSLSLLFFNSFRRTSFFFFESLTCNWVSFRGGSYLFFFTLDFILLNLFWGGGKELCQIYFSFRWILIFLGSMKVFERLDEF